MNLFEADTNFEVIFQGSPVKVEKRDLGNNEIFIARFSDRAPLVVTRAKDANAARFWTSVPEGRQELADAIGKLIGDHIKKSLQ